MEPLQVLILALLQGLTEFLPISSAAHLVLLPVFADWPDQGLRFDVAVHVGTLAAVLTYFRREVVSMTRDWARSLGTGTATDESRLAWYVVLGTVPVGLGGLVVSAVDPQWLRSPRVIAVATIVFALALWWADRAGRRARDEHALTWRGVLLVGCAQLLALVPGTSRSGVTMTAGLALGLTRAAAARFSFLLSIPVIMAAGLLESLDAWSSPEPTDWGALLTGAVTAAVCAYSTIHLFLRLLDRIGFLPFVLYRLALGVVLLALLD